VNQSWLTRNEDVLIFAVVYLAVFGGLAWSAVAR
jgi:hypothetical protein